MAYLTDEERLKKQHIVLMRHKETALYGSVMMMGESAIADGVPTAYTDGTNKKYGREFFGKQDDKKARGLIMHENLHVALMHIPRHKDLMREDGTLANVAMDIIVNNIIDSMEDKNLCELPEGGILDHAFDGWSVREVYNELKKQNPQRQKPQGGNGSGSGSGDDDDNNSSGNGEVININGKQITVKNQDHHDIQGAPKTAEEMKKLEEGINRALREGGILAGRLGAKIPREVSDSLEKPLDWKEELREFVTASVRGRDELTWRRFNRSLLANDILAPSVESETMTEIIVAIDTSGSISQEIISTFAMQLQTICDSCKPETVRVLWWDTEVHGEQVFLPEHYHNIKEILKPQGGGGTMVSCVSEYVNKQRVEAEALVVFTDGYLESEITWNIKCPTLWLVTQNSSFQAPSGKVIKKND